jgi:hypothetical protein
MSFTTTRSTVRSTALGAALALLFAGATACGTGSAHPSARAAQRQPATQHLSTDQPFSIDLIGWAKAHQPSYRYQAEAARANGGDPSRGLGQHQRGQQPPGYNKALLGER